MLAGTGIAKLLVTLIITVVLLINGYLWKKQYLPTHHHHPYYLNYSGEKHEYDYSRNRGVDNCFAGYDATRQLSEI